MKTTIIILFVLAAIGVESGLAETTNQSPEQAPNPVLRVSPQRDETALQLRRLEDQFAEVRRDQLNYKIEKDLLEKAYSSNWQIINGGLTLFLVFISVVGIFGIRDVYALKEKFTMELARVQNTRTALDQGLDELRATKAKIEQETKEQVIINDSQNKKIRVLEIQEKTGAYLRGKVPQRALEYAAVGLELDPHNALLQRMRAKALWDTGDLTGALRVYKKQLEQDAGDEGCATDAMELALLIPDIESYKELVGKFAAFLEAKSRGCLKDYLKVLELFQTGKVAEAIEAIKVWLAQNPVKKNYIGEWEFADVQNYLMSKPDSGERNAMVGFTHVLKGELEPKTLLEQIGQQHV